MNMELYEIYKSIVEISDGLMENRIEFTYDRLSGVMGCHPAYALEMMLPNIGWDTQNIDMNQLKETLDELVEFNKCFKIKELKGPIKKLKQFIKDNK